MGAIDLLGPPPARRRRTRLLAACALAATLGVATKHWTGPGQGVLVGQGEDFFGTVFLILAPRVLLLRAPLWKVAGPMLAVVVGIEISQAFHGDLLDRARSTWLGAHVLVVPKGCPYDAASMALHGANWPCYLKQSYLEEVRAVAGVATARTSSR